MKCPTCKEAVEGKCCSCGYELPEDEQHLEPNPYAEEIGGDAREHLECEGCRNQSALDI